MTQEPLPEGCTREADVYHCEWTHSMNGLGEGFSFLVPVHARTLATVTIILDGKDNGWQYHFWRAPGGEGYKAVSTTNHQASDPDPTGTFSRETTTNLLLTDPADPNYLSFISSVGTGGVNTLSSAGPVSPARVRISFTGVPLPDGTTPSRPAATRDDPHLLGRPNDTRRPDVDLLAAWLDDASMGDGIFDAHVAVASLEAIDFNYSRPRGTPGPSRFVQWSIGMNVGDEGYRLAWNANENGTSTPTLFCALYHATGSNTEIVTTPACELDVGNATLHAFIPEASVGSPGNGVAFSPLDAQSGSFASVGYGVTEDRIEVERYAFALGGPDVWSELNPRLDPTPVTAAAFYQDPLAPTNLADSLQVLGAILAVLTFVIGFFALRRTRRQTRELLHRVDVLVALHERDAREALVALGRLESEFATLYRDGRINETQYQVAAQRVVAAASRMALRRELGLDDGTPN